MPKMSAVLKLEKLTDKETAEIDFKHNIYFNFNGIICCVNYKKGYLTAAVNNKVERYKIVSDEEPIEEPNNKQLELFL